MPYGDTFRCRRIVATGNCGLRRRGDRLRAGGRIVGQPYLLRQHTVGEEVRETAA